MTKAWLGWAGRVIFTVGAVWFLSTKLNWSEFGQIVRKVDGGWLGLAVLTYGGVVGISIVRWHLLLEVAGAAVGWVRTAQLSLAGLFFNSVLPGMMGGDVMRAYWAAQDAPQARPAAVVSILLERVLGLTATVGVGAALILPHWSDLTAHPVTRAGAYAFLLVSAILLVLLVLLAHPASGKVWRGNDLSAWRKAAGAGAEACHVCLTHPVGAGAGLGLSVIAQLLLVTLFFSVSQGMGLDVGFWQMASVLPMVAMITVLPITWNGLGLREAAFVTFLGTFGIPTAASVAISLIGFAVILAWNLVGGLVYLTTGVGKK